MHCGTGHRMVALLWGRGNAAAPYKMTFMSAHDKLLQEWEPINAKQVQELVKFG